MPKPNSKHKGHVFICTGKRYEGHPLGCCTSKKSNELLEEFKHQINRRGLADQIAIGTTTCRGPCSLSPNIVVYPGNIIYSKVKKTDVKAIIEHHLLNDHFESDLASGKPVDELIYWANGKVAVDRGKKLN